MRIDILTPSHKYWKSFYTTLSLIQVPLMSGEPQLTCGGDLRKTTEILKFLPHIDVEETLNLYRELGVYCDCEVLMNLEDMWETE